MSIAKNKKAIEAEALAKARQEAMSDHEKLVAYIAALQAWEQPAVRTAKYVEALRVIREQLRTWAEGVPA